MTPGAADLSFETPRVKARLLCEDDLDLYLALYTDPEVMRYIGPVMGKESAADQFGKALALNREEARRVRYWSAYSVEDAVVSPLGILSAVWREPRRSSVEIGIMLSGRMQRSGLGRQLLTGLIDVIFDDAGLDVDVVTARYLSQNIAARKLFSCVGFSTSVDEDSRMEMRMLTLQQWHRPVSSLAPASVSS